MKKSEAGSRDFEVGGSGVCELCGRAVAELTKHHLIPRSRHNKRRNRRDFDRAELHSRVAWLCRPCHRHVHATIGLKELEREYNTLEQLAGHPEIAKFTNWVRNKAAATSVSSSRRKRGRTDSTD